LLGHLTPEHKHRERSADKLASDAGLLGGNTLILDVGMKKLTLNVGNFSFRLVSAVT